VTECFEIGTVYMPDAVSSSATYLDFLNSLKRHGVTVKKAKSGIEFSEGEVKVEFLGPVSEEYEDLNNYSAVVKVTYGKNSFLFTGDAEELVETELLQSGADLKADVLKVGHHGSDSSSCDAFLAAVDPKFAVISCGKGNDYGHPHKEVLERLKKTDAEIFRTDINGDITLVSDGTEVNKYYDLYN